MPRKFRNGSSCHVHFWWVLRISDLDLMALYQLNGQQEKYILRVGKEGRHIKYAVKESRRSCSGEVAFINSRNPQIYP